jgi:hypothetical protein
VFWLHAKYTWKTADLPLVNTEQEFVPGERIAWDSLLAEGHEDSSAYHGWVITPTDSGCNLLTEEAQQGPFFAGELGANTPVRCTSSTMTGWKPWRARPRGKPPGALPSLEPRIELRHDQTGLQPVTTMRNSLQRASPIVAARALRAGLPTRLRKCRLSISAQAKGSSRGSGTFGLATGI